MINSVAGPRYEIGRGANKSDVSTIGTNCRTCRTAVSLAVRSSANERRRASLHVAHEYMIVAIGAAGHEVRRVAVKGHIAAVPTYRGIKGVAVAKPRDATTDERCRAGLAIAYENVISVVGVAGHQISSATVEGNVSTIGTCDRACPLEIRSTIWQCSQVRVGQRNSFDRAHVDWHDVPPKRNRASVSAVGRRHGDVVRRTGVGPI